MNKITKIAALVSLSAAAINAFAAKNPASVEYVNEQLQALRAEIASGNVGPIGPTGPAGAGGITTGDSASNIAVTGAGSALDPYVVSNTVYRIGQAKDGGIIVYVGPDGTSGVIVATSNEVGTYTWANALLACQNKGAGWVLPSLPQATAFLANYYALGDSTIYGTSAYWTSSVDPGTPSNAAFYVPYTGLTGVVTNSNTYSVRCFRTFSS